VLFDILSEYSISDLTKSKFSRLLIVLNSRDRQGAMGQKAVQNFQIFESNRKQNSEKVLTALA
jgi:hypothetical protein